MPGLCPEHSVVTKALGGLEATVRAQGERLDAQDGDVTEIFQRLGRMAEKAGQDRMEVAVLKAKVLIAIGLGSAFIGSIGSIISMWAAGYFGKR